jgi:predicted membrane GTPase involved in stress response
MTPEDVLGYVGEDELVDVTLKPIRLRKKFLGSGMRK